MLPSHFLKKQMKPLLYQNTVQEIEWTNIVCQFSHYKSTIVENKMKNKVKKGSRNYSPSMNHLLVALSNWQSAPLHGCCCGTHGSPFHPKRRGRPRAFFSFCSALTKIRKSKQLAKHPMHLQSKRWKEEMSTKSKCLNMWNIE